MTEHASTRSCSARINGILLVTLLLFAASSGQVLAQTQNPVVVENANPGTDSWIINNSANDTVQQIKGYASATSVNKGQNINFFVSVNTAQTFGVDFYRMGWYNGARGRLMKSVSSLNGTTQAKPVYEPATGMVSYQWNNSYTLAVPTTWTSGIYLAKLTNIQGYENYISFVVRDDARTADLMYQQPVTTYQAYNPFPRALSPTPQSLVLGTEPDTANGLAGQLGNPQPPVISPQQVVSATSLPEATLADIGKSLYEYNSSSTMTDAGTTRALKVSFDRPYEGLGDGQFFSWEYYLVGWLEQNGYDVAYSTDIDLHRQGASQLQRAKALISTGHDEYWSKDMYDAAEQVRDSGKDIAFMGSNAVYWQIRLAPNASGTANRVIICYKDPALDPETNPALESTRFRDVGRPEQSLVGVQYIMDNDWEYNTDYVVTNSDHWVYAGTGFNDGDTVRGITGYEVDTLFANVAKPLSQNQTVLASSPFTGRDGTSTLANASIYQAPSGAWVFATGTMSWPWALLRDDYVDTRIQIATNNILQRFINGDPVDSEVFSANFDTDTDGFNYVDDTFRNTSNHAHANGYYAPARGFTGSGIAVRLGGGDNVAATNMSGGWQSTFDLTASSNVTLTFRYVLSQTPDYESDEYSEMLVEVDGQLYGTPPNDYIARVSGDGDGGSWPSTNWQLFTLDLGTLAAGTHQFTIGGFGNQRSDSNENTEILIDDVTVTAVAAPASSKLYTANFDTDTDGFNYVDDTFRNTSNHDHANGYYAPARGFTGGGIAVRLGSGDNVAATNMSGGWRSTFNLTASSNVTLTFRYVLSQTPDYESDEYSEMLVEVDGQLYGTPPNDYIARVSGDGDGGSWPSTNWQLFTLDLGTLAAGTHQFTIGGFGNQRSDSNENTEILIDDVTVTLVSN